MGNPSLDKAASNLPAEKKIQTYFPKANRTPASEAAAEEDPNKMAAEEQGSKISVYPDLPQDVLQKRRDLRPITEMLRQAKIKYKWISHIKLQVSYKDKTYYAQDLDSGKTLLQTINLMSHPDLSKHSQKRKCPDSPDKEDTDRRAEGRLVAR
ncbi:UNVERIFIED_CONTAM: hypothetical protein K2H54_054197 [Gekko kuhli]